MKEWNAKKDFVPEKKDATKFKEFLKTKYVDKRFEEQQDESSSDEEQRRKAKKEKKKKVRKEISSSDDDEVIEPKPA